MNCPDCDAETVTFAIPKNLREYVDDEPAAAFCTHCLSLYPASEIDTESNPDFAAVSDSFPAGEGAVAMALVISLLDSLALHRTDIETLLTRVERAGIDPLLVLDRLAADPTLDPTVDLGARHRQIAQFRS